MLGLIVTALASYNLTGGVTPFHFAAIAALVTIAGGLRSVLMRRPARGWVHPHATWMAWLYVGLMGAFAAESLTRFAMPALSETLEANALWGAFWTLVGVGSFAAIGTGAWLIRRKLPEAIEGVDA